MKNETS